MICNTDFCLKAKLMRARRSLIRRRVGGKPWLPFFAEIVHLDFVSRKFVFAYVKYLFSCA